MSSVVPVLKQGAEAKISVVEFLGRETLVKERFVKTYRHPVLDRSLTTRRVRSEVRSMTRCRLNGISTPCIYFVDTKTNSIYMEYLKESVTVREYIGQILKSTSGSAENVNDRLLPLTRTIGRTLSEMHSKNIIHGDLTTSNMLLKLPMSDQQPRLVLIDFGLGYTESLTEDKAVDLYVLERAFLSSHPNTEEAFRTLLRCYSETNAPASQEVMRKLDDVRRRGRKRTMVG